MIGLDGSEDEDLMLLLSRLHDNKTRAAPEKTDALQRMNLLMRGSTE